jgi:hypothetical protein
MNDCADADCSRGVVAKGVLTPATTRTVANGRNVAVAVPMDFFYYF